MMSVQKSKEIESPELTVAVVYDNKSTEGPRIIDSKEVTSMEWVVYHLSQFSNEENPAIPLHISNFTNKGAKSNKFTVCIPKKLNDYFSTEEGKAYLKNIELNIVRYIVRKNSKHQKIHGLFIPGPRDVIQNIFTNLEKGFIRAGSYSIIRPPADETGRERNYNIILFESNQKGVIPKQFVEKIKVLIEDTEIGSETIRVKWLNKKVYEDISKGVNKKIGTNNTANMEY